METLLNRLRLTLPIIQAPMAGGVVTPSMIAEVNNAGGLGSLPLGYLTLTEAEKAIRQTQQVTDKPFAVNVFIPAKENRYSQNQLEKMLSHINYYRQQLGLTLKTNAEPFLETDADDLVDMAVAAGISIISFTFGTLSKEKISALKKADVIVMGTATSVKEGKTLEALGCDAVVAQGYEAGGHRGGDFIADQPGGLIGTMVLVPQMVDALKIPVIAAGGIMNGRGVIAALALGAQAVQMGTAFLTCLESNASPLHKKIIMTSDETATTVTSVFTGKHVRAINNNFVRETESKFLDKDILPYPLQHQLTAEFRKEAVKSGTPQCGSFWSGQGNSLCQALSIADFMKKIENDMQETVSLISQINSSSVNCSTVQNCGNKHPPGSSGADSVSVPISKV
ncbi:MAG: nitronate monooxygenase [Pseudomonadota bacterium]